MQFNTLFRSVRWTKYVSLKNLIQRTMPLRKVCILYSPESCSGRAYSTSLGQHVSLYRMVHHINVVFFFCRLKADVFTSRDQCQRSKCKVPFLINVLRVYKDKSISFLILQTCHTSLSPNNSSEREGSSVIRSSVDLFQVQQQQVNVFLDIPGFQSKTMIVRIMKEIIIAASRITEEGRFPLLSLIFFLIFAPMIHNNYNNNMCLLK